MRAASAADPNARADMLARTSPTHPTAGAVLDCARLDHVDMCLARRAEGDVDRARKLVTRMHPIARGTTAAADHARVPIWDTRRAR